MLLICVALTGFSQKPLIKFRDSVEASAESPFATNVITIINLENKTIDMQIKVSLPYGWSMLGDSSALITLPAREERAIAFTIKKTHLSPANWTEAKVYFISEAIDYSTVGHFYLKAVPIFKASVTPDRSQLYVTELQAVPISFTIKNIGNAKDRYSLSVRNDFLLFNNNSIIELSAGESRSLTIRIDIPIAKWDQFKTEKVYIEIQSKSGVYINRYIEISRIGSRIKDHPSPYDLLDLSLGTGTLINGSTSNYYGSISGKVNLNASELNFSYKSKQYGNNNNLYQDVYSLNFNDRHYKVFLGQVVDAKYFYGMGRGIFVERKDTSGTSIYLSAIKGDKFQPNAGDLVQGGASYLINRNVTMRHDLDFNSHKGVSSYLMNNVIGFSRENQLTAELSVGFGFDQTARGQSMYGLSLGYEFRYKLRNVTVQSKVLVNDNQFPGLNRGGSSVLQQAQLSSGKNKIGLFYIENKSPITSLFTDTLFNTDALRINTKRYGLSYSLASRSSSQSFFFGRIQSSMLTNGLPAYLFMEYNSLSTFFKSLQLDISSTFGMNKEVTYNNSPAIFNNSTLKISSKWCGLTSLFTSLPVLNDSAKFKVDHYTNTFQVSPFFQMSLKNKLRVQVNYSFSKALLDDRSTTNIIANISYAGTGAFDFNAYAMIPVNASKINSLGLGANYVSVTAVKRLNVPVLLVKRYHSLKAVVYNDINNNRKRDKNEPVFDSLPMKINDVSFRTGKGGTIEYANVTKGTYTIDVSQTPRGYMATNGNYQSITLKKDFVKEIPVGKSNTIYGKIKFDLDSLSNIKVSVQGIKVSATDTLGNAYSALANEAGYYYINVPSGYYLVSLNPDAFDNAFRPVRLSYTVEVKNKDEQADFEIRQQRRKIRLLK